MTYADWRERIAQMHDHVRPVTNATVWLDPDPAPVQPIDHLERQVGPARPMGHRGATGEPPVSPLVAEARH